MCWIPDCALRNPGYKESGSADMTFWVLLTVNSVTFGGLLFLLSAGFSLIFGLMRIPNLTHGSMFMVGAYLGTTLLFRRARLHAQFLAGGAHRRRSKWRCSAR